MEGCGRLSREQRDPKGEEKWGAKTHPGNWYWKVTDMVVMS